MNPQSDISLLWQVLTQDRAKELQAELDTGKISVKGHQMRFEFFVRGRKPANGYTLIFGFHGGGGCAAAVNQQQYNNHKHLYDSKLPIQCIWVVARSAEDVWNMWFLPYIDEFITKVSQAFILNKKVNPNKVFISGYSAGGDGVYHLAPRLADQLAGAAMMAGHPNDVKLQNCRNMIFSIQVGGLDAAYNRNDLARKYIGILAQLQSKQGGFDLSLCKVHQKHQHWMSLEDAAIFPKLFSAVRNCYPEKILFRQYPNMPKQYFYYLQVDPSKHKQVLKVCKTGNKFEIEGESMVVRIYVNRSMVDFTQPVNIYQNGKLTCSQVPCYKEQVVVDSILAHYDPCYIFQDCLISDPNKIISANVVPAKQIEASPTINHLKYIEESSPMTANPLKYTQMVHNPAVQNENQGNEANGRNKGEENTKCCCLLI